MHRGKSGDIIPISLNRGRFGALTRWSKTERSWGSCMTGDRSCEWSLTKSETCGVPCVPAGRAAAPRSSERQNASAGDACDWAAQADRKRRRRSAPKVAFEDAPLRSPGRNQYYVPGIRGNLDEATGEEILNLIAEQHRNGLTIVMVTHDPAIAERADRIVHLHGGLITY